MGGFTWCSSNIPRIPIAVWCVLLWLNISQSHWYFSRLLRRHWCSLTIASVAALPWGIWVNKPNEYTDNWSCNHSKTNHHVHILDILYSICPIQISQTQQHKSQEWLEQFVDIQNHVILRGVLWGRQLFILRASHSRALSQYKDRFSGVGIPMLKIRRSLDRLIFNKGIPILVRRHLYIEMGPSLLEYCHTGTLVVGREIGLLV